MSLIHKFDVPRMAVDAVREVIERLRWHGPVDFDADLVPIEAGKWKPDEELVLDTIIELLWRSR